MLSISEEILLCMEVPRLGRLVILIMNNEVNVHGSVYRNNILIYNQQDATLHSLFYLETALPDFNQTSYLRYVSHTSVSFDRLLLNLALLTLNLLTWRIW